MVIVAAEAFELRWISPPSGWRVHKVAKGPGPALAAAALDLIPEPVDAVVSAGICGALDPSLRAGDIVMATEVNGERCKMAEASGSFRAGPIVSVDRVVDSADEKRRLREKTGALAVEMEAAGLVSKAKERAANFFCIRAVSDEAGESFAVNLNASRDDAGRFRIWHIAGQALRRPAIIVPELLRLRRNAYQASRALGEFFAGCNF